MATTKEVDRTGVHVTHCCVLHGCKYASPRCPVVKRKVKQESPCEYCEDDGVVGIPDPDAPNYDLFKMSEWDLRQEVIKLRGQIGAPVKGLKGKRNLVIEAEYRDLENLVVEKYPFLKGYRFAVLEQCHNDSVHAFDVNGEIDDYGEEEWELAKEQGEQALSDNATILNKLCADGFIEPGEYNISVCW